MMRRAIPTSNVGSASTPATVESTTSLTSTAPVSRGLFGEGHALGRTVTQTDNAWFTLLTQNTAALHVDHPYAAQTEYGRPLVNSTLTLALVTGESVSDVSQNVMANLGWDEVRLPHPLFEGDTVYSTSEVLEARESKSRSNVGIVTVRTTGFNQDGTPVIVCKIEQIDLFQQVMHDFLAALPD